MRTAGFGCLLLILSMVLLIGIVVIPVLPPLAEEPAIDNYLEPLLCPTGSTIVRDQYSMRDSDGTSYTMDVYCETDKDRENVTDKWIMYGLIGFVVPFVVGLLLFIGGIVRRARRAFQDPLAGLPIAGLSSATVSAASPISGSTARGQGVMVVHQSSATSPVEGVGIDMTGSILRVGGMEIDLNALKQGQVETFVQQAGQIGTTANDLVGRLKQLQEARDAGLITSSEYDRLRQELLDNWTD
ncbi:MAG: hypothetical protein L6Q98_01845 [Anaerolineae bacterium]|nr:hypothetical protein [Anaerolineae bacterium]NUQ05898.1 SHOCT domain-containing protein [Anaerolineae bacterium]